MATTIIAKFLDGRLLVQESKKAETAYSRLGGVQFRITELRAIEQIVSVSTDYEKIGVMASLAEATISGQSIGIVMRRNDVAGFLSGDILSSMPTAYGLASGVLSGLIWGGELISGARISGLMTITANVIGY